MTRQAEKTLLDSSGTFNTLKNLIKVGLKSKKSNKFKLLTEYREKFQEQYLKLDPQWQLYKLDVIEKDKITAAEFDAVDSEGNCVQWAVRGIKCSGH